MSARFDASAIQSYVEQAFPADTGFTVIFPFTISSAALAAFQPGVDTTLICECALSDAGITDGFYLEYTGSSWGYWTELDGSGPTGTFVPDTQHVGKVVVTVSGTAWTLAWYVDNVLLFTDTQDTAITGTSAMTLRVGAIGSQAGAGAGAAYDIAYVQVLDSADAAIYTDPFVGPFRPAWTVTGTAYVLGAVVCKIFDLASTELADISLIALEKSLTRLLDQTRTFTIQAPAGNALLTADGGDGYPVLRKGNRKLLVWENGTIIFHGRIFGVERVGDGDKNRVTITALEPWMELGYDSGDRAGRVVRAGTVAGTYDGNFINPQFEGTGSGGPTVASGPDLIYQALFNTSRAAAPETDPTPGDGPLPIDLTTGTFDLDVPPAIDLMPSETMSWPKAIGDFIRQLIATGVCDVDMRPVDPAEGLDPYVMVAVSAVSSQGSDKSGTVHFDYWTGSKNAKACRHVEDFATICNKLYDYLGPPQPGGTRWLGNITPGSPGTTIDPTASRALYGGEFMQIRFKDTLGNAVSSRPLYLAEWNSEQGYRVEPRDQLWITPNPGAAALFDAPRDFDVGDLIAINVGSDFGLALAENQRVYGYTKTWDRQGVARLSELLTSADVALA